MIRKEIYLAGNWMLTLIDKKLHVIKQVHNQFMGGLDLIMTRDFYQAPLVRDFWIFKRKLNGFNILGINCWHWCVQCYELHQVMWQNDIDFIHVLNSFQTRTQTIKDISYINNICLKPTWLYNVLPYLFYTNIKTNAHNKKYLI